ETLAAAITLRPETSMLHELRADCQRKLDESRQLGEQLHRALAAEAWPEVAASAERLLAISPECPLALDARRRAWNAVGMHLDGARRPRVARPDNPQSPGDSPGEGAVAAALSEALASSLPAGRRFLLWIDGVGGYLVCEGEEIILG